jgi:hypothetical protein
MKTKILAFLMTVVLVTSVVGGTTAQAKAKKTTYNISSYAIAKFSKSGNKLVVKIGKTSSNNNLRINGKVSHKKKLTFTLSKKCKWYDEYVNRGVDGSIDRTKITYKRIKRDIKGYRSEYVEDGDKFIQTSNGAMYTINITVKNGKVTKVAECNI